MIAPDMAKIPLMVCGGLMVMVVAFTSIELTLYLLIFSTLLSPELTFGGGSVADLASGRINTTESRGTTLRLDDILLTLICLVWLFRMAVYKELGSIRETPINQPITWYWMVTLLATIMGFYAGRVGGVGFFFVVKYLEYFMLFYMIINHLHDEETIKRFLTVMLFTCFVACLVGISQIPSGQRVSAPFEGVEGEPNSFGGYLVLMFSIVVGIFLYSPKGRRRLMMMGMMGLILVPLAFTESRSSYLSLVAAIGLFVLLAERKNLIIGVCLAGLALAPVILPQNVIDRVMFTFNQASQEGQMSMGIMKIDTSTSERLKSWENVLTRDFPKNPLLGVGVTGGDFLDAQYPRVLLETGLIGLLLFLWLLRRIWVLLRQCYHNLTDPVLKGASLGAICGYGGLLVHAIGANSFIIVRIMEPFMILVGLLLAALLIEQDKDKTDDSDEGLQSLSTTR
ncbi:MAG: O-antigen ligase family protein [Mariprofundaceae bacterium]